MNRQNASIRIGSYTLAMRSCELLRQNGISCILRKISDSAGQYGCLYSVQVDSGQQWAAEKILRNAGIMILP